MASPRMFSLFTHFRPRDQAMTLEAKKVYFHSFLGGGGAYLKVGANLSINGIPLMSSTSINTISRTRR